MSDIRSNIRQKLYVFYRIDHKTQEKISPPGMYKDRILSEFTDDISDLFQSELSDLKAENERLRKALIITKSHASDIRMTNIGFKPNGYDVVKTGQNIEDIAQAALEASA